jgi:hypothetical protein
MPLGEENGMCKKEIVAMFMESPFYFDLMLRERLELVQGHENRLSTNNQKEKNNYKFGGTTYKSKNGNMVTKIIVGYFSPKNLSIVDYQA